MGDLIKLTNISYEKPIYVMRKIYIMKNKILFVKRVKDEFTHIGMIDSYIEKVKELPEDINKDVNLLKFTSYESDEPVYIAKDAIVGFLEEPGQTKGTCINLVSPGLDYAAFKKGVVVKELAEEVRKIIEGE